MRLAIEHAPGRRVRGLLRRPGRLRLPLVASLALHLAALCCASLVAVPDGRRHRRYPL
jgi:hypothetical protein